jgi:hypothetical protein
MADQKNLHDCYLMVLKIMFSVVLMKEFKISLNDEEIIELKKMFRTDNADEAVRMAIDQVIEEQTYKRVVLNNDR